MAYLTEKQFDFRSSALPEDTFGVVDFKGFEGFSKPYEFEILLVSSDPEIDLTEVLQNPAVFTILREDGNIPFNGILAQFEQLHAVVDHVFYRAVLVPRFWWLSLTQHNQIFLDKTVPEIIGEVLEDGGLTTDDYELRISNDYPKWEYICQYRESHQSFVSRWMEREGMYYFFEQTEKGEKLIITDSNMSHTPMAEGKTMYYSPPSGLEEAHREEVIRAVVCKQKLLPAKLHVNDYNYRKPSLSLSAEAEVLDRGRGDVHLYGEHFRTPEEGQELARIRAEELLCHEKRFHGESTIPFLRPGYLFELQNHYRDSFNQKYLTIELEHEGSQVGYLLAGIQEGLAKVEGQPYYRNSFVTIPSDVQYRHPKTTEKPSFNGTLNARIDAEGTGEYAELDEYGRYKVRLPFDVSGRNDGRASHWLRMAQPYGGENQGMHFPLHKHTEVLLTFVEGNPDRPIIAATVPNPESPSLISSENQTKSIIKTGRGPKTGSVGASWKQEAKSFFNNYIEFDDQDSAQWIHMHTPGNLWFDANNSYGEYIVFNGMKTDPDAAPPPAGIQDLVDKMYDYTGDFQPTNMKTYIHGQSTPKDTDIYGDPDDFDGLGTDDTSKWQFLVNRGQVRIAKGDTFITQEGNVYDFGGYWVYNLGNCYIENHLNQKAKLNDNLADDLLDKGGPDWGTWKTIRSTDPFGQEGSRNELKEPADSTWKAKYLATVDPTKWNQKSPSSNNWEKIWVEKKFGDAYEYRDGHTVSVTKGSTQEIKINARSIEEKYSDDKKTYYMKSGPDEKWETKWDRHTGKMLYDADSINKNIGGDGVAPNLPPKSELTSTGKKYNRNTGTLISEEETKDSGNSLKSTGKKYNRNTGALISESDTTDSGSSVRSIVTKYDRNLPYKSTVSYSDTTDLGHQVLSYKYSAVNKTYADISISGEEYFTVKAAGAIGVSLSSGLVANFKFPLVAPIPGPGPALIAAVPLPLTSFDLDLSDFKIGLDLSGFSFKLMGFDLKAKTSAEIVKEGLLKLVKTSEFSLERGGIKLSGNTIEITAI